MLEADGSARPRLMAPGDPDPADPAAKEELTPTGVAQEQGEPHPADPKIWHAVRKLFGAPVPIFVEKNQ